jgi:hypothetical protein
LGSVRAENADQRPEVVGPEALGALCLPPGSDHAEVVLENIGLAEAVEETGVERAARRKEVGHHTAVGPGRSGHSAGTERRYWPYDLSHIGNAFAGTAVTVGAAHGFDRRARQCAP